MEGEREREISESGMEGIISDQSNCDVRTGKQSLIPLRLLLVLVRKPHPSHCAAISEM